MFMAAVALAVAAIPEGLPAIMTIISGHRRPAHGGRNAIVRRLPAVETLGAVTVICSDKTGTLTRNEMTVQRVVTADRVFEVSGVGYAPIGDFSVAGAAPIMPEDAADLPAIARAVRLCNDANLREHDGEWRMDGDPTEGALLTLALQGRPRSGGGAGAVPSAGQHSLRVRAPLHGHPAPRPSRRHVHPRQGRAGTGAGDVRGRTAGLTGPQALANRLIGMPAHRTTGGAGPAGIGGRLPARPETQHELTFADVAAGLTLLGLLGISDPPREEAIQAVRLKPKQAGIRVKMITGDHGVTARAIAAQIGIGDGRRC
jgi:magnesium-transporting ATPase (P-type)